MAYLEVWKNGRLITRRRVDNQKAQKGCRVRLGSAGEVRVAIGQSETLGKFEVRMFAGEPPVSGQEVTKSLPQLSQEEQALTPLDFSVGEVGLRADESGTYPNIEGYKIIETLGEGGMGVVWRAEQLSTKRQVALKLMTAQKVVSSKAHARFQREVELTARLDHPSIARIYDSGIHRGMYYYAMELIDGEPLDHYVKAKTLSREQILVLMKTICQAIHYAHLHGVIHRDLKPSNIIIGRDGQPHVVDFGLARTFLEESEAITISVEGEIAGTPAYMSPEQAAGRHAQIDTRTDVFSLAVILYELLTGQSPHDLSGSLLDILNRIIQGKIRRPREITKSIDRELEAILLKALAQSQKDRYASAGDLQDDIENYLNGEPLRARAPTTLYFLRKRVKKYRVQVGIGLAVSLILLGIILTAYTRIVEERAKFEAAKEEVEIKTRAAELSASEAEWAKLEIKVLGKNQEEARAALQVLRSEYVSAQQQVSDLQNKLHASKAPVAVRRIDLVPGAALASTALVRKPYLPGEIGSWTLETYGHRGPITKLAYSPDGNHLGSTSQDGIMRLWNAQSGQLTKILIDPNGGSIEPPWFVDGRGPDLFSWSVPDQVGDEDKSARTIDEIIKLWKIDLPDVRRPPFLLSQESRGAAAIAMSADRSMLALGDHDGTIRVLNLKSGQLRYTCIPAWCGPVHSVCYSSDGKVLATCAGPGTICLWDTHSWQPLGKFQADDITDDVPSAIGAIAWSPDGAAIARVNNSEKIVEILDSQSGQVLRILYSDGHKMACVSWSPDGRLVAAGMIDGVAYLWNVESDSNEPFVKLDAHTGSVNSFVWMPDGQTLVTAGEDGRIRLWEPRTGKLADTLEGHTGPIACLAPSPQERLLSSGGKDGTIRLWDIKGGRTFKILRETPRGKKPNEPNATKVRQFAFTAVAWSADGRLLASGDSAGNIHIWDPNSRQSKHSFEANCGSISSLAWSPDGRILTCGGVDGTARAWEAKDYQEYVVLLPLWGSAGPGIAISREGDYRGPPGIADHLVYVVSTERGQETLTPADFKSRFGWVNEPWQVGLYSPGLEQVQRIYVKADAKPPYDGNSWNSAFNDLQEALKIAQPNTEIWVAAGIYKPDRRTGAREASFHLKNGVRLFGGFSGTEISIDQRDPNRNETILSGDLKGDDRPDFTNYDENSYYVIISFYNEPNAVLDGFIISGGNADGGPELGGFPRWGGGMYNANGSPTVVNCIFRCNSAGENGGGIANINTARVSMRMGNCQFVSNSAKKNGGGMHNWGSARPTLVNCIFRDNFADKEGAAIYLQNIHTDMTNCTFIRNSAKGYGGAIYNHYETTATVNGCTFIGNSTQNCGGGISIERESKATITNCTFINNSSRVKGGAIFNQSKQTILLNCRFLRNSSGTFWGGAVFNQGGKPIITNCIFIDNEAMAGGGLYNYIDHPNTKKPSNSEVINCTFISNRSKEEAGGIFNYPGCSSKLTNCILWGNTYAGNDVEAAQIKGGIIDAKNCCVQGWSGKLGGTGNFDLNPLFLDPNGPDGKIGTLDDNLRLDIASPCRNVGDNSALPADTADLDNDGDVNEPIPFDIEGKPRILNGAIDFGAYESG